jgi:CBS domain-containing protein
MDVRELMAAPVFTVAVDDTLSCAAKLMRDHAIGCLPVVDEHGTLVGVLTDRDIALQAYEWGEALWQLRVDAGMHQPAVVCHATNDIATAARLMREHRVRRLPVVEGGRPIGIISLDDLARASREPILDPTPGLTCDELADLYDATSGRTKQQH